MVGRFLQKMEKSLEENAQKRATMQGFADRSGASEMTEVVVIFKNIQPISVGV